MSVDNSGGFRSVRDIVEGIRRVVLGDDDIIYLENPEPVTNRPAPSDTLVGNHEPVADHIGAEKSQVELESGKGGVATHGNLRNQSVGCSVEVTKDSSLAAFVKSEFDSYGGEEDSSLISQESMAATTEEIQSLLYAMCPSPNPATSHSCPTIEELAVSLLKPELSMWLNKNLRRLVKEIVEKEISKLVKSSLPSAAGTAKVKPGRNNSEH